MAKIGVSSPPTCPTMQHSPGNSGLIGPKRHFGDQTSATDSCCEFSNRKSNRTPTTSHQKCCPTAVLQRNLRKHPGRTTWKKLPAHYKLVNLIWKLCFITFSIVMGQSNMWNISFAKCLNRTQNNVWCFQHFTRVESYSSLITRSSGRV